MSKYTTYRLAWAEMERALDASLDAPEFDLALDTAYVVARQAALDALLAWQEADPAVDEALAYAEFVLASTQVAA